MLSLAEIKKFYSKDLGGFERFMLREYLQYKLLEIVFESSFSDNCLFWEGHVFGLSMRIRDFQKI